MTYKDYLYSKRNLLISWFTLHSFALFVNFFGLRGQIDSGGNSELNLLTNGSSSAQHFWPFVSFRETRWFKSYAYNPLETISYDAHVDIFNGVFYQYDISEFIAYSTTIFLLLYVLYSIKK